MRRVSPVLLALALVSCATPTIRLTATFTPGAERTYVLDATATTTIEIGDTTRRQRSVLRARSAIKVIEVTDAGALLELTLTPTSLRIDDREVTAPSEQRAELLVAPDGSIERITSLGGVPAEIVGTDLQELAPLLGGSLPATVVEVGDRWTETIDPPDGEQLPAGSTTGRVAGLRVVQGYDTAIVALATRRPLTRERPIGEQTVRLVGVETSASEIAFAFREGFPVRIETTSEGTFDVASAGVTAGVVRVLTDTVIRLDGSGSR